jgi:hypothetical protein
MAQRSQKFLRRFFQKAAAFFLAGLEIPWLPSMITGPE